MEAQAERNMPVRCLDRQSRVAKREPLHWHAKTTEVARTRYDFGRHRGARGQPYGRRARRDIEPVKGTVYQTRQNGFAIDQETRVSIALKGIPLRLGPPQQRGMDVEHLASIATSPVSVRIDVPRK